MGALPRFLRGRRRDVRVVLPLHRGIDRVRHGLAPTAESVTVAVADTLYTGRIWEGRIAGDVPVYFVECAAFFDREDIYAGPHGDYPDNPLRFIFFCRAALETAKAMEFRPDIVHAHDMQTGLIPAFLRTTYRVDAWFNHTRSCSLSTISLTRGYTRGKYTALPGWGPPNSLRKPPSSTATSI